jgi:tRNA-specific 2-thiouridylase
MGFTRPKVLVAMSGGVDSSVAAALLVRDGYEVVGCFMRLGSPGETLDEPQRATDGPGHRAPGTGACSSPSPVAPSALPSLKIGHQGCCSINDAADARLVAAQLGVPFYVCNFKKDFGRIIDYFVDEYGAGRTPNPCVRCNDWLKFGKLHDYARQVGAQFVASGHYARIESGPPDAPGPRLMRGVDRDKDQSYVLFGAPRERLRAMLFPVGALPKARVRDLAREFGLPVFDKPDSQEICFVPDNDYAGLVERRRPALARRGPILDEDGRVVGTHAGQHRFTIGQRRGVGVALGYPIFVVAKDAAANTVTVAKRERLAIGACTAGEANWLTDPPPSVQPLECLAKYRYNSDPVPARVTLTQPAHAPTPSGRQGTFEVVFDQPQHAVAPGQAVVLYSRDEPDVVLAGGWITHAVPANPVPEPRP